jgi:hypothetical protein
LNKTKRGIESITQFLPFGEKSITGSLLRGITSLLPERDPRQNAVEDFYSDPNTRGLMSQIPGMDQYNTVSGGLLNMLTGGKMGEETTYGLSGAIDKRMARINKTLAKQRKDKKRQESEVLKQRLKDLQALKDREAAALNRAGQIRAQQGADRGVSGGGRGSRRGDADISDRNRGSFKTDDTAGFF